MMNTPQEEGKEADFRSTPRYAHSRDQCHDGFKQVTEQTRHWLLRHYLKKHKKHMGVPIHPESLETCNVTALNQQQ